MGKRFPLHAESQAIRLFPSRSWMELSGIFAIATLAVFVLFRNSLLYLDWRNSGLTHAPAEWSYDDVDYDNIAFSINKHGVYGFDWDDPEWKSRYELFNQTGYYNSVLVERKGFSPTTFKPPLVPFIFSIAYKIFGSDFIVGRLVNFSFMAVALFLSIFFVGLIGGSAAAFFTALMILVRPHPESFSMMLMTESVGTFIFTAGFISVFCLIRSCRIGCKMQTQVSSAIAAGVFLGLLPLARSLYVLWIPFALFFLLIVYFNSQQNVRRTIVRHSMIVSAIVMVLIVPWGIRNSIVTGHFNPFGAQGMTSLPGGFSDESYQNWGQWAFRPYIQAYNEFEALPHAPQKAPAELPYLRALYARDVAVKWIRDNPEKILPLVLMRMYSHVMQPLMNTRIPDTSLMHGILFILMVLGAFGWMKFPEGVLYTLAVLIDLAVIGITYPDFSRYLTPLIPVYGMATAGILFLPEERRMSLKSLSRTFSLYSKRYEKIVAKLMITLVAVIAALIVALQSYQAHKKYTNGKPLSYPPACACDDADYDMLAFSLATKNSYEFDWENSKWRSRYLEQNEDGRFTDLLSRRGSSVTTYYPPLLPFVTSVIYRVFGDGFAAPRLVSLLLLCLTVVFTALFAGSLGGVWAAIFVSSFLIFRRDLSGVGLQATTESMAIFFFTVTFFVLYQQQCTVFQGRAKQSLLYGIVAGVCFALLGLARTNYNLWFPFIACISAISYYRIANKEIRSIFLRSWVGFFCAFLLLSAPWWIRNSLVTGHFYPLGSKGAQAVSGSYSDESYASGGEWSGASYFAAYTAFNETFTGEMPSGPEYEYLRGVALSGVAMDWIRENPKKILPLFAKRIHLHYFSASTPLSLPPFAYQLSLILIALGVFGWMSKREGWIFLSMFFIDAVVIALTYENSGRFLMPLLPAVSIAIIGMMYIPQSLRSLHTFIVQSLYPKKKNR